MTTPSWTRPRHDCQREQRLPFPPSRVVGAALVALAWLGGCASHSERTFPVRSALDRGDPRGAVRRLDEAMGVSGDGDLPRDLGAGSGALLLLDRGSVEQSLTEFEGSKRDLEAADKAIDMLDIAHDATDSIGEYVFSGSSGRYQAPPYEKLLVNTLDMINYLELHDLDGARVEARRLAVMQRYVSDELGEHDNPVLGLGAFLAGFTFEESGDADEALRWYDDALRFSGFDGLRGPVRALLSRGSYRSPRLEAIAAEPAPPRSPADEGEIVVVVGYGRVPHKIAERVPIGLALTSYANALSPANTAAANRLAAQGLVTWINFPALGPEQGGYDVPRCTIDGASVALQEAVDVAHAVRSEWMRIQGKIVVSAITRLIARYAAGTAVRAAAGNNGLLGGLLSLGTQATLAALDTPDTRSWETLPARVAVARVRVSAGPHSIWLGARGAARQTTVSVDAGGWAVTSLMALR